MPKKTRFFHAPAKINLFLKVLKKRQDGYHNLQTAFRMVDLCDQVGITVRNDGVITRTAEITYSTLENDLVIRAAQILKRIAGVKLGADIAVKKLIPVGSGMGGGSSDAATTLMALNKIWKINYSREILMNIAAKLGADIPFFLFGKSAFGEGIGDQLTEITLPPRWYLLVFSKIEIPTAGVFEFMQLTPNPKAITIQRFLDGEVPGNDLERSICNLYPSMERLLGLLRQHGDAKVTGSGSTVFFECDSMEEAEVLRNRLPDEITTVLVRGLDMHPSSELLNFRIN